jgi:hypothetical protein
MELILNNEGKPSRGSFEIYVQKDEEEKKTEIWSGKSKGPPRKDKFPDVKKDLVPQIKKILKMK